MSLAFSFLLLFNALPHCSQMPELREYEQTNQHSFLYSKGIGQFIGKSKFIESVSFGFSVYMTLSDIACKVNTVPICKETKYLNLYFLHRDSKIRHFEKHHFHNCCTLLCFLIWGRLCKTKSVIHLHLALI